MGEVTSPEARFDSVSALNRSLTPKSVGFSGQWLLMSPTRGEGVRRFQTRRAARRNMAGQKSSANRHRRHCEQSHRIMGKPHRGRYAIRGQGSY